MADGISTAQGDAAAGRQVGARPGAAIGDRIVAAALECYRSLGIAKTTMHDVASQAGLSRPTIYRHFANRDRLVAAVVTGQMRVLLDGARRYIATRPSMDAKVADGLVHLVEVGTADPVTALLFDPQSVESTGGLEDAFGTVVELTTELWRPVFHEARANGELDAGVDIGRLCSWFAVVSLITAGRMKRAAAHDPAPSGAGNAELRATLLRFVTPALRHGPARS